MARIAFLVATVASVLLAGWFVMKEMDRPGLSIALALIVVSAVASSRAFSQTKADALSFEVIAAGWIAVGLSVAGTAYLAAFFSSWLVIAIVWLAIHGFVVYAMLTAPPDQIQLKRVGEQSGWFLYEFSNSGGTLGKVSVNSSNGQLEIVEVTEPGTEAQHRAQLAPILLKHHAAKNYP